MTKAIVLGGSRGIGRAISDSLKTIDVDVFARKAVEARDSEYIPDGDEMIAYTGLIGGGESITVTFDAPEQGVYNFICTFPAHYQLMRGQLIVK